MTIKITFLISTYKPTRHFDVNNSGAVHYGEFVWAFFNRKKLVRQWKRNTEKLTKNEIINIFHQYDTNGDNKLNINEFKKLLKSFQINNLTNQEIEILMEKFDIDNNKKIDLQEFLVFIQSEQTNLYPDEVKFKNSNLNSNNNPNIRKNNNHNLKFSKILNNTTNINENNVDNTINNDDNDNSDNKNNSKDEAMWIARMLQAQSDIENRLGKKYYKN